MQNKYPANCHKCGVEVPAGAGELAGKVNGRWLVQHSFECPEAEVATPTATTMTFPPTEEQAYCIKLFATHSDLVIKARAGTGKTSTLRFLANHAKANGRRGQYVAYNKAIVKDVGGTMPGNVNCSTMHSLAYRAVGHKYEHRMPRNFGRQSSQQVASILGIKMYTLPDRTLAAGWLAGKVMEAVRKFCGSVDTEIGIQHFAPIDGIDAEGETTNSNRVRNHLVPFARKAWDDLVDEQGQLRSFDDVYLKIWSLGDPRINADFVALDEAQDADPVQAYIVEYQRQFGTQIVAVGDDMQVLYEWRGAVDALAQFERMGAQVAYLTQSFRFGNEVARVANGLLTQLGATPLVQGYGELASTVGPIDEPDAILCRSNAGTVTQLFQQIAAGRKAALVGGGAEVTAFCKAAQELQTVGTTQHPELAIFDSWTAVQEYVANDPQGGDLKLMVKLIDEFGAEDILEALKHQPNEKDADVVLSTAHKSKGREWDNVQIAGDFKAPEGDEPLSAAELRLAYVAVTRAKRTLDITQVPHFGA